MKNIFLLIANRIKYTIFFFIYVVNRWYNSFYTQKRIQQESAVDTIALYVDKHNTKFLNTFTDIATNYNANIDDTFYSCEQYKIMVGHIDHPLEKQWKTKILMEFTPFGNVVMYYDVFRNGFAYYSDINLSYNIINAVAMKYVLTFSCRDFFMDERILPEEYNKLPILKVINEADKEREKEDKKAKKDNDGDEDFREFYRKMKENNNTPFIKHRSKNAEKEKTKEKAKEFISNKFIYQGKIVNFQMTQKQKRMPVKIVIDTNI